MSVTTNGPKPVIIPKNYTSHLPDLADSARCLIVKKNLNGGLWLKERTASLVTSATDTTEW